MAASIVCNDTVALIGHKEHLILKIVAAQGLAMIEGDNFSFWVSPILVKKFGSISKFQVRHIRVYKI